MRGNSRINKEEQVKVVIRLKPDPADPKLRCVYLSDSDENELVVETDSKKEIFQFDHVAHEATSQQEVHRMIGQECVGQTLEVQITYPGIQLLHLRLRPDRRGQDLLSPRKPLRPRPRSLLREQGHPAQSTRAALPRGAGQGGREAAHPVLLHGNL